MSEQLIETHPGYLYFTAKPTRVSVLSNGQRVFSSQQLMNVFTEDKLDYRKINLGGNWGVQRIQRFLAYSNIRDLLTDEIIEDLLNPIEFINVDGSPSKGFPAERLYDICELFNELEKRPERGVPKLQQAIIEKANTVRINLGRIGVLAIIDEATGYIADKEKEYAQLLAENIENAKMLKILRDEDLSKAPFRCSVCGLPMAYDESGKCETHREINNGEGI